MAFHVDAFDWWFYAGTPAQRLGIDLPPYLIEATTYLDVGSKLPAMVPPTDAIFNELNIDMSPPRLGAGFMHGSEITLGKRLNAYVFEIGLKATLGYNVAFGKDTIGCPQRIQGFGWDDWRFFGNAYAGLRGNMAVRVPKWVCFTCGKVTVADLKVAAYVSMEGPNPYYAQGAALFEANVLNGLWEPSWTGSFKVGERCPGAKTLPDPKPWNGLFPRDLIVSLTPDSAEVDVKVGDLPRARLSLPVGRTWTVDTDSFPSATGTYKMEADMQVAWVRPDGYGLLVHSSASSTVDPGGFVLMPSEGGPLPPNQELEVKVRARIMKLVGNTWQTFSDPVMNLPYDTTAVRRFTTSEFIFDPIITDVSPKLGDTVGIFTPITVQYKEGRPLQFRNGSTITTYLPELQAGSIGGTVESWTSDRVGTAKGYVLEAFPVGEKIEVPVRVAFVNKDDATDYLTVNGRRHTQEVVAEFHTADQRYTKIAKANVRSSYPYPDQYNVYLDEPGTDTWFIDIARKQTVSIQKPLAYVAQQPTQLDFQPALQNFGGNSLREVPNSLSAKPATTPPPNDPILNTYGGTWEDVTIGPDQGLFGSYPGFHVRIIEESSRSVVLQEKVVYDSSATAEFSFPKPSSLLPGHVYRLELRAEFSQPFVAPTPPRNLPPAQRTAYVSNNGGGPAAEIRHYYNLKQQINPGATIHTIRFRVSQYPHQSRQARGLRPAGHHHRPDDGCAQSRLPGR